LTDARPKAVLEIVDVNDVRGRVRICRWGWVHHKGLKGDDNIECRAIAKRASRICLRNAEA
jgi:hypothetical protein